MAIKLNRRSCFYILLTVLCLLLLVRYSFRIEIPRIVLTAIIIIIAFIGDKNEILAITIGCIPLQNAIDFYICLMICAVILVFKNYKQVKIGYAVLLVAGMIIWELVHCFFFDYSPKLLLVSLVPLIFIAVILSTDIKGNDYAFIVRIMALLTCYMCIIVLITNIVSADGNIMKAFVNLRRLGILSEEETLLGGEINPNSLGIVNVLGITGILQIRALGQKKRSDIVLVFIMLVFGMLTLSRTFLVCLAVMFVLVLFGQRNDLKKTVSILGGTVIICVALIAVTSWLFPELLENFFERFQVKDITTGRIDIMGAYHEYIVNNPEVMGFGIGLTDFNERITGAYSISRHVPHNSIQEIILCWGIPGLLMIILMVFVMIVQAKRYGKKKMLLNYIPLIIILVKAMAGQLLTSGYTLLALVFAYLSLCQNFSDTKKEKLSL